MDTDSIKKKCKHALGCVREWPVVSHLLHSGPRISVLRFAGVISDSAMKRSGISHSKYAKIIEKAFASPKVQAVVLLINSPGGSPAQASLIAGHIRQLASDKEKPVYAFVEDVAASGGYWLACAADEIYAQDSSIVGSIGVISAGFGLDEFIKKHDVTRRIHTAGKDKGFMDPFIPEREDDVKRLNRILEDVHKGFKAWVRERRGEMLKGTDKALFEGDFWSGGDAADKGLIDGLGDMRSVIREKYGEDVKFSDLSPEKKLFPFSILPGSEASRPEWIREALDVIEDRSTWARYGL